MREVFTVIGPTPDANALIGDHPPASLSSCATERSRFRDLFLRHRQDLIVEFERFRPTESGMKMRERGCAQQRETHRAGGETVRPVDQH